MSAFVSGALGALAVLLVLAALRAAFWRRRFHRAGRGGGFFLRRVALRIGARPEQETVIAGEADRLAAELRALRGDAHALRAELADLVAGETLDADRLRAALDARLARVEVVKARLAEALARIHAALDGDQRARLASLVRSGPHGRFGPRAA